MTMTQKLRHRYHIESLVSPVKALFYCCATVYCSYLCFDPGRPWCPARLIRATDPLPTRAAGGLPLAHLRVHVGRPRSPILIALAGVACFPTAAAVRLPLPRLLPPSGDPSCSPCSHGVLFLRRFGASVALRLPRPLVPQLLPCSASLHPRAVPPRPSRAAAQALLQSPSSREQTEEASTSSEYTVLTAIFAHIQNMSVRPKHHHLTGVVNVGILCRYAQRPHSANDGVSRADHSNYLEDFPTDFNFKANRPICPSYMVQTIPTSPVPNVKRKHLLADPPTSDAMLNGAPGSSSDFPTDFNFESTRRIRRRLHTHTSDLGQPDRASSPRLHVKRKSSASCRLSEPSCSRINEVDEDEQQPSNMQVSSSGHRQRLYLMNTLGYVMPR
ncbi:hypothetical protein EJB05_07330, partial [Eragrostis curvula]